MRFIVNHIKYQSFTYVIRYNASKANQPLIGIYQPNTNLSQIGFYGQLEYGEPRNATFSLNYQF